jgi:penicillin-binding protein 1A
VVRTGADEATVLARSGLRYRLGMEGIRWARTGDVTPKSPRDVMKIGDVVYVLPTSEGEALLAQVPDVQGAIVALDPHDGSVVALSGGFDYNASSTTASCRRGASRDPRSKPFIIPPRSRRAHARHVCSTRLSSTRPPRPRTASASART